MQQTPESHIEINGTVAAGDLKRFNYFHYLRRTWWVVAVLFTLLVAGFALSLLVGFNTGDYTIFRENGLTLGFVMLFWIAIFFGMPHLGAQAMLKSSAAVGHPVAYIFTPNGFRCKGKDHSSKLAWNHIWKVSETGSQFLLYVNAGGAICVPKRFFEDEAQIQAWRGLVASEIAPKTIEAPGFVAKWC